MPSSFLFQQIRPIYLSYKAATKKVKSWLGLADPCTCRQILAQAKASRTSGKTASKKFMETLNKAISKRMEVSEAMRPRAGETDREWMNHNHFIYVLKEVRRIFSTDVEITGQRAQSGPVPAHPDTVCAEDPSPLPSEEMPQSQPSKSPSNSPSESPPPTLSAEQLDAEVDDLEDLLDMLQKCADISDSVRHIWKQVLDSQLDFVSASTVMNCAYRDIRASVGVAKIFRDVWGNELDDQLSELAKQFGLSEGLLMYQACMKHDYEAIQGPTDPRLELGMSMLGQSLQRQEKHPAKYPVPFFQDLVDHVKNPDNGEKLTMLFGLQLYSNMVLSVLPETSTTDLPRFALATSQVTLANTYAEAINSLCTVSCSDPKTRDETLDLIKSFGIHLDGIKKLPAKLVNGPQEEIHFQLDNATVSNELDIWSLGHQLGRLYTFCTKLMVFSHLSPRASPGIFSFLYKLNAALLKAGGGTEYTLSAKYCLEAQEMLVFRQKRPSSMEELSKCLKNVLIPGVNDTNNSAIRKVHAKRCRIFSEDVSASLIYVLHTKDFGITKDIQQLLDNNKRKGTTSVYHALAVELKHQIEHTYNGVNIDFAAKLALASISQGNEEVTAASLRAFFRKTSPAKAKKIATDLQGIFCATFNQPGHYFLPRMPIPRMWLTTDPKSILTIDYFHMNSEQFQKKYNPKSNASVGTALRQMFPGDPGGLMDPTDSKLFRHTPAMKMMEERFGVKYYLQCKDSDGKDGNGINLRFRGTSTGMAFGMGGCRALYFVF